MATSLFEDFLPWYLSPSGLNAGEDAELERRRQLTPTITGGTLATTPNPGKASTLVRTGTNLWTAASGLLAEVSPEAKARAIALAAKVKPGATLPGLLKGTMPERQVAIEVMAKSGYDMQKVDDVLRVVGVAERAELMANVESFLVRQAAASDATVKPVSAMSRIDQTIYFGQIKALVDDLALPGVDELYRMVEIFNTLDSKMVAEYKLEGLTPAGRKLGYV